MTEEVINNKLNYLEETKDLIASSIESYGVDVNENDTFRSYASKIREIPKINPEDYYTKVETNNLIDEKISEIPAPDLSNYYTKSETEGKINELDTGVMTINGRKPNPSGNIIIDTPDMSEYYDKLQIDNKVQELNTAISEGDTLTLSEAKSYADALIGSIEGFTVYVGDESDYDIMPPEQKAAYDLFILDRNVELTQEELTSLSNILGDDSETISNMSEDAANEALDEIIEPQEEVA